MKRMIWIAGMALISMTATGQSFRKGGRLLNFGIGVGKVQYCGPTFTQKISMEWGVANVGKRGTIGLGVTLANAYGGVVDGKVAGVYDYKVSTMMYKYADNGHGRWMQSSYPGAKIERVGIGTADARFSRDDVKILATVAYHHAVTKKLDVYGTFGLGFGIINGLCGNFHNYDGFEKETKVNTINTNIKKNQYCLTYSYDDLDHIDFSDYRYHKVAFSCGFFAGARYSITNRIGAFAELGLVSGAFKGDYNHSIDVLTLGVSLKL